MITKEQALEFIYELSKNHSVDIDIPNGTIGVDGSLEFGYNLEVKGECYLSLEALLTKFIKENIQGIENFRIGFNIKQIPVDIDMLEVGKVYKVHVQEDWNHRYFTEKFMGFDEEDSYILNFENSKCSKYDIREMYEVIE